MHNLEASQSDRVNFEKLAWDAGREAFRYAKGDRGGMALDALAIAHLGEVSGVDDRFEAMAIWSAGFSEGWMDAEQDAK